MSRAYPLQSSLRGQLKQDFIKFRDRENLSDAEATRQLLTLALRIKLNDSDDDRPSNRELMEEIYRVVRQSSAIGDVIHGQTFDGEKLFKDQKESQPVRRQVKADIDNQVDSFLAGKKKRVAIWLPFFLPL
ncbi:hypothetical protein HJ204_00120 [Vibrio parahaemolyticus]|nr:hypothetical protein [Vibrio parahaemolyticus]